MQVTILKTVTTILLSTFLLFGCSKDDAEPNLTCSEQLSLLESDIHFTLDNASTDTDFTLSIKAEDGKTFVHSRGSSTATTMYESASTSKMISAAIILDHVKKMNLSLDDNPQDHIGTWPITGNLAAITLHDLLSFTSGLTEAPLCLSTGFSNIDYCVDKIAEDNNESLASGLKFYYGPDHLQVAGQMAIQASAESDWASLFATYQFETGLFTHSTYDLPSASNPRLAGGMHWNAEEYLAFLEKLYKTEILTPQLITLMTTDQRAAALSTNSPAIDGMGEDWHYGFGVWIESESNPYDPAKLTGRVSSPGLFGAYPFIDFTHKYYGILARQGSLTSFTKGYELFSLVAPKLETWATTTCE